MNDIKPFDEMTKPELVAYLTSRGKAGDGDAMIFNTKTLKADLIEKCKAAHRRMIDGDQTEQDIEAARNDDTRVADMMTPPVSKPSAFVGVSREKSDALMSSIDRLMETLGIRPKRTTKKFKFNKRGKRHARFN